MVLKHEIFIKPFGLNRLLHIYVPDNIKEGERFPVMYMFDGHNLFFDSEATYGKSWGIKDFLDNSNTRIIVVGLECNHEGNKRLWEFSPYSFKDKHFGTVKGYGKILIDWMADFLKPMIDKNFPTLPEREFTGLGGSSMGGLMSVYGTAMRSDIFSMGACLSPFYDHIFKKLVEELSAAEVNSATKFYISWGRYEVHSKKQLAVESEKNLIISRVLTFKGVQVFPQLLVEGAHNEASWETENPIWMTELGLIK